MRAISFGAGATLYTFPITTAELVYNFADLVPATTRLPGVSGGYNAYGNVAAPSEVGSVRVAFTLIASTKAQMEALRDSVNAMARWGVQKLLAQPSDTAMRARWCVARINNIQMNQNGADASHDLWQKVSIDFQVSFPRWYSGDAAGNPNNYSATATAARTTHTVTVAGNATTKARIVVYNTVGPSTTSGSIAIYRIVTGIDDSISTAQAIPVSKSLDINARAFTAVSDAVGNIYGNVNFAYPNEWFRLEPGANTILFDHYYVGPASLTFSILSYDLWY